MQETWHSNNAVLLRKTFHLLKDIIIIIIIITDGYLENATKFNTGISRQRRSTHRFTIAGVSRKLQRIFLLSQLKTNTGKSSAYPHQFFMLCVPS